MTKEKESQKLHKLEKEIVVKGAEFNYSCLRARGAAAVRARADCRIRIVDSDRRPGRAYIYIYIYI